MLPLVQEVGYVAPDEVFLRVANEPYICFLDSAGVNQTTGRYSYLAFDPFQIISVNYGDANPFAQLQQELTLYATQSVAGLPPFQGGAMGYFAYDLAHYFEKLPRAADDLALPLLFMGFYDCILSFDNHEKRAWIISHGFPELETETGYQRAQVRLRLMQEKFFNDKHLVMHNDWPKVEITGNFAKDEFLAAIAATIEYIYAGDIFQANIAQRFMAKMPDNMTDPEFYWQLRHKNLAPFSAFMKLDNFTLASASPERFLSVIDGHVEARPIKGTARRSADPELDKKYADKLLASTKDRAENVMIVDLLRNDLARCCDPDSIQVTQLCGLESYPVVHHLVSVITGKLNPQNTALDLLITAFPAGSITGAPKIRAMEIIHEIEPVARGIYCGNIGYLGFNGNMDTSVVIRTALIKDRQIYFHAGGGIVADSDVDAEYEESLLKAGSLAMVLQGEVSCDSGN